MKKIQESKHQRAQPQSVQMMLPKQPKMIEHEFKMQQLEFMMKEQQHRKKQQQYNQMSDSVMTQHIIPSQIVSNDRLTTYDITDTDNENYDNILFNHKREENVIPELGRIAYTNNIFYEYMDDENKYHDEHNYLFDKESMFGRLEEHSNEYIKKNAVSIFDIIDLETNSAPSPEDQKFNDNICTKYEEYRILIRILELMIVSEDISSKLHKFDETTKEKITEMYGFSPEGETYEEGGYLKINTKNEAYSYLDTFSRNTTKLKKIVRNTLAPIAAGVIGATIGYKVGENSNQSVGIEKALGTAAIPLSALAYSSTKQYLHKDEEDIPPFQNADFKLLKIVNLQRMSLRDLNKNSMTPELIIKLQNSELEIDDPEYLKFIKDDIDQPNSDFIVLREILFPNYYIISLPLAPILAYTNQIQRENFFLTHLYNLVINNHFTTKINIGKNVACENDRKKTKNEKEDVIVDSYLWLDQVKKKMPEAFTKIQYDFIEWYNSTGEEMRKAEGFEFNTVTSIFDIEDYNCKKVDENESVNRALYKKAIPSSLKRTDATNASVTEQSDQYMPEEEIGEPYIFCKTDKNIKRTYFYNKCIAPQACECCNAVNPQICMNAQLPGTRGTFDSNLVKRIRFNLNKVGIDSANLEKSFGRANISFVGTSMGGGSGQLCMLWLVNELNKDDINIFNVEGVFFNSIRSCSLNAFEIMKRRNILPIHFIHSRLDFYRSNHQDQFYIPKIFIDPITINTFNPLFSDIPTRFLLVNHSLHKKFSGWQMNSYNNGIIPLKYDSKLPLFNIYKMKNNTINKYNVDDKNMLERVFKWTSFNLMGMQNVLSELSENKPAGYVKYLSSVIKSVGTLLHNYLLKFAGHQHIDDIKLDHYLNESGLLHNALDYFDSVTAFEKLKCNR